MHIAGGRRSEAIQFKSFEFKFKLGLYFLLPNKKQKQSKNKLISAHLIQGDNMGFIQEFKEFAMKGNVIDMAVGVVIGGAFGKIVTSLVSDIMMPILGLLTGGMNFTDLKIVLKEAVGQTPAVTINYGSFIQVTVDFIIIAFCIFCAIKAINKLKKPAPAPEPAAPAEPSEEIKLLSEIRDLLKK